jgi:hypothetical protein
MPRSRIMSFSPITITESVELLNVAQGQLGLFGYLGA